MGTKDSSNVAELDYYIREFGEIIRINTSEIPTAKEVLNYVFQKLSSYKALHN